MPWLTWLVSNIFLALLLALSAWVVQRWLRRPAIVHVLWVLVLIKLMTPPLVSVPMREAPRNLACTLGTCNCAEHQQTQATLRDRLPWVLLAAWSVGAGTTAWIAWCRWRRFQRLMAHADPAPPECQALAAQLASELSLRTPEILVVPGRLPPLVVSGRDRPRLLLPAGLLGSINASQRTAMILHELAHIKRGDHLVRILEMAVGVAYWWLPVVGSIGRQLLACEESCCDAVVVARRPEARREYARLLLDVIDFAAPMSRQAVPQATAMSSAADGLERRLRAILGTPTTRRRTWPVGILAVVVACAILPLQLRYDFVGRPSPAISTAIEPGTEVTPAPTVDGNDKLFKVGCCTS